MELVDQEWYESLIEEIGATWVETQFISRWSLIEGYHRVGELIRNAEDKVSVSKLVQRCAEDLSVSERKVWYAVKFYDTFPNINALPEDKTANWSHIKNKYLTEPKEEKDPKPPQIKCPNCGHLFDKP